MIDLIFYYGTEIVFVRVEGTNIKFSASSQSNQWATIDGLKINKAGVLKEHPDLEGNDNWKQIAIERFKKHISLLDTEDKRVDYIIQDLKQFGYKPKFKQKKGFRRIVINE